MNTITKSLFPLGHVVITQTASNLLSKPDIETALTRHANGDWGNLCADDQNANNQALEYGQKDRRLLSAYVDRNGTKFWIITDADRSATTILLPEDYGPIYS